MSDKKSVYEVLSQINVSDKIEKKGQLSYLSWSWAWSTLLSKYPLSAYKVYENDSGYNYHTDSKTAWVKVGVAVENIEHIEYLPIMDFKNKSISLASVTSMDVNKAIQRALTKAIARHGLGLYIYAGEDLPEYIPEYITEDQKEELEELLIKTKSDIPEFMKWCKVSKLSDIEVSNYKVILNRVKAKLKE
jgi:hypothetical protein